MADITVLRTGDVPLVFAGEMLAEVSSRCFEGMGEARWHELAMHRTAGGTYVLAVSFHSQYRDEGPLYEAVVTNNPDDMRAEVPTLSLCRVPVGIGFPPEPRYEAKQARMVTDLERRFDQAVTELFVALGPEFAERIE